MDKESILSLLQFLESATDEEIQELKERTLRFRDTFKTPESKSDANLAIRLIEEEIIARNELFSYERKISNDDN